MIRSAAWSRRPLTVPPDVAPDSLVDQQEAAAILGVDRRTLQRAHKRGEGPVPVAGYVGPQKWYQVQDLLDWHAAATGTGPEPIKHPESGQLRPNPPRRPDWWPRGERRSKALRRKSAGLKRRLAWLELGLRLAEKGTESELAGSAFDDAVRNLRRG